jgi:hypothetical protein
VKFSKFEGIIIEKLSWIDILRSGGRGPKFGEEQDMKEQRSGKG